MARRFKGHDDTKKSLRDELDERTSKFRLNVISTDFRTNLPINSLRRHLSMLCTDFFGSGLGSAEPQANPSPALDKFHPPGPGVKGTNSVLKCQNAQM